MQSSAQQQQQLPPPSQAPHLRPDLQPPPGPQAQIVCGSCRTLLMYPQQGAQNVRCGRCSHITAVPPAGGCDMAQLVCNNQLCRTVLMYPRGASQVQCSVCQAISCAQAANSIGHLICRGCHMTLMYAHGAETVKCALCNVVTAVTASNSGLVRQAPGGSPSPQGAGAPGAPDRPDSAAGAPGSEAQQPRPATRTVVVENPPDVDEHGTEHQNLAVGVTSATAAPTKPPPAAAAPSSSSPPAGEGAPSAAAAPAAATTAAAAPSGNPFSAA